MCFIGGASCWGDEEAYGHQDEEGPWVGRQDFLVSGSMGVLLVSPMGDTDQGNSSVFSVSWKEVSSSIE